MNYKNFFIGITITFLTSLVILLCVKFTNNEYKTIDIENVILTKHDEEKNIVNVKIIKKDGLKNKKFYCKAINKENEETIIALGNNNECAMELSTFHNYDVMVEDKLGKSNTYDILNFFNNELNFEYKKDIIYLIAQEEKEIEFTAKNVFTKNIKYEFISKNSDIAKVENNKIVGISSGVTEIYAANNSKSFKVIVTDLITKPKYSPQRKQIIACNKYSFEEQELLDELLKVRIEEAGFKTRAGAVAAARFLTLEFPYRIPYFYENGRVHPSGVNYADGEGRYYHYGLYLGKEKYKSIKAKFSGPASWGCPLNNWEDEPGYGYYYGAKAPNGLDCSGFVAWALYNGGFDPGDVGAGETDYPYQMTDLGNFTSLTSSLINSNTIKAGDLFNYFGHIAIIVGIDKDNFYVAESLPNFGGVVTRKYSKKAFNNTFTHVVLMDEFYKKDGNYNEYWN